MHVFGVLVSTIVLLGGLPQRMHNIGVSSSRLGGRVGAFREGYLVDDGTISKEMNANN